MSTATQNELLTHETDVGDPTPLIFIADSDHLEPFQVRKFALESTAMQNDEEVQDTPVNPPLSLLVLSTAVGPAHFPEANE